jgi:hypothetical protein
MEALAKALDAGREAVGEAVSSARRRGDGPDSGGDEPTV